MKFPIAFRVFGAINLVGFLLLALQTILLYSNPKLGFMPVALGGATALWFLISAFVWMFASDKSYTFLYLTAMLLLAMTAAIVLAMLDMANEIGKEGLLFTGIYGTVTLIYTLFMIITLFFKPVKEWLAENPESRKKIDFVVIGIFAVVVLVTSVGFYSLGKANKKVLALDEAYVIYDTTDTTCFAVNLNYMAEFSSLSINTDDPKAPNMIRVRVQFADNYEATKPSDFFRTDTITLTKKDNKFEASFEPIRARRINFCDLGPNQKSFYKTSVSVSHEVDYYNLAVADQYIFRDGIQPPYQEGYDGEEYYDDGDYFVEGPSYTESIDRPDAEPTELSYDQTKSLIEGFLNEVDRNYIQNTQYDFNETIEGVTINGRKYGTYRQFRSTFDGQLDKTLNDYIFGQYGEQEATYSKNQAIRIIAGVNIYNPNGYEGSELPFGRLNPEFVIWIGNNLLFANDEPLLNETVSMQAIYNNTFRRTLWLLAASYEYLGENDNMDTETSLYWNAMEQPGFEGVNYLWDRFGERDFSTTSLNKYLTEYPPASEQYYYFNEEEAIGFWMRRHLDGTDKEVFKLLQKILESYDSYTWG